MKNRSWLYLAILTLVVALTWATVSAISHFRKTTVTSDIEKATAPLDPNLDMAFFTKLKERSGERR
mgnify:CR=1 FL=1